MEKTNEYLLLFQGKAWWNSLSAEELQKVMDQVKAWFERLTGSGKLKAAQPLAREGAIISGRNGRVVADGPFAESKEVIGGYALVQVNSLNEAIAIARSCPTLEFDMQIEARPVGEGCPMTKHARQMLAEEQFAAA